MTAMPQSSHPPLRLAITAQALTHGGGAERYLRDVVSGLHAAGVRPSVLARKIDPELPQAAMADGVRIDTRGVPRLWRSAVFDWKVGRWLRRNPTDCVFAVNHSVHADVAICGGTHPGFLQAMGRRAGPADHRQIALERRTYARARRIVAHSELMKDELQRFHDVAADRIDVLYPPVDADRFRPLTDASRRSVRKRLGLPPDRVVFLLVSTGHTRKGFDELEALFATTDLPITLAVAGRPLPRPARNVVELGYRQDVETVFAAADYTVVASRYEPFGLVGVESVLCGTPVVIADTVGSAEVIGDSAKVAYSRSDPQGLSTALAQACSRAQAQEHRIADPAAALRYDPAVRVHVDRLLALFRSSARADA